MYCSILLLKSGRNIYLIINNKGKDKIILSDDTEIKGFCKISGLATIGGTCDIGGNTTIEGNTKISGNLTVNTIYTFSDSMTAWGAKDITINVLDAEGAVVATGTYSLAAYYNEMADQATADELALLEAMYALAYIGNTNN